MMNYVKQIKHMVGKHMQRFIPSKHTWSVERLERGVVKSYIQNCGKPLNLRTPVLFTEKIQWYKLHYRFAGMERIVDKYLFKDYIREKLGDGFTIPLYGVWDSIKKLEEDWETLPEEFCLKSTVQSDGKYVKMIHGKSSIRFDAIRDELSTWLAIKNTLINSYCSAYYGTKPRILAEKYEKQVNDQLYDYKFFCFDGEPYCVYVAADHFKGSKNTNAYPISFYDLNWHKLDVRYGSHANDPLPKPRYFDEMIAIAKKLSKGFPFIRVDFFETTERPYCAELTLYPGGGIVPYHPESFNLELGRQFHLPMQNA